MRTRLKEEVRDKIISKKSKEFLGYIDNKYLYNQPYLNFLKSMIIRVKDWNNLSAENFLLPVKRLLKKYNQNIYDVSPIIEILELINEHSEPNKKKIYGDVFTPFSVVNNMLDKLPDTVWNNPYLKWFDPANGFGNFPLIIIQRLMNTLKDYRDDNIDLRNETKRFKHIIENMIYMCDVQTHHNLFVKTIFHNSNLYIQTYLRDGFEYYMKNVWKIDHFDVIICSPPYNNNLYDKFTDKSIELLRTNGLLLQINPASWRKPRSLQSRTANMWNSVISNNLKYLEIHNLQDGNKVFKEYRRYDILLMEKKESDKTIIIDEKGNKYKLDLTKWEFLPNYDIHNIIDLFGENCERILFSRTAYGQDRQYVSDTESVLYKYPLVHYIKEDGVEYMYSAINDKGFFGVPKVIFAEKGLHDVIIDLDGKYGMTSHSFALKVNSYKEALEIKEFLLSKKFKDIIASCSWGSYSISLSKPPCFIDWRIFNHFKENFWKSGN